MKKQHKSEIFIAANEYAVEKTHPLYYNLAEQRAAGSRHRADGGSTL